jgi:hypothetical protein
MLNDLKRYFYREKGKIIWCVGYEEEIRGPWEFSFDKKTIYNFWTDYEKLNNEQRAIFNREFPVMASLKDPSIPVPPEPEDDMEEIEEEYEYSN